jgi:primosomal protein N' (replication factor Y) (superfamily II helicase)
MILRVALDAPLRQVFDYRLPGACAERAAPAPRPGVRVEVPFGRRRLIGILVSVAPASEVPEDKLREALAILDTEPVFDAVTFGLLVWAAEYYHHPIGEVFAAALPASLRAGQGTAPRHTFWSLTSTGRAELDSPGNQRGPRLRALLAWLGEAGRKPDDAVPKAFTKAQLRTLAARGWIEERPIEKRSPPATQCGTALVLSDAQAQALAQIAATLGRFAAHLLYGVTGSGKTEIYLHAIASVVAHGGQAVVLVPEIALTPQLVARFEERFGAGVAVLHSRLAGIERRDAWRAAHSGAAHIVIGTRSAVFTSLPRLALIIVDEEHDASYKQHEGFRYSARDLAVLRAQRAGVPIVLGSATPSLESMENAAQQRYTKLLLPQRAGAAQVPHMTLVDMQRHASEQGLSQPVLQSIGQHLRSGGQVIVFLNRRGYAPTLFCRQCGWVAPCAHCDARMTLHLRAGELRCHHCGARGPVPLTCASCNAPLSPVGQGTERVEETLSRLFPDAQLVRLDRDTAAARGGLQAVLGQVRSGRARILVGTQMLTKGHHFPDVSLVIILDADQGLFATDYRATERLAQTIIQVSGRAGRASRPGEVMIQTAYPNHPLLQRLISEGYDGFAASALEERREASWPPYIRLALLRAEARQPERLDEFLRQAASRAAALGAGQTLAAGGIRVLGPASAMIARRADHYRAHLLTESADRGALQRFLARWVADIETLELASSMRWSLDVDPLEVD